jgi:AraC-like DNA-binding protein
MHCAELARRFPAVRVEPDPIFVRDGAIWTSAGVTAAIDLALALVEEDVGRSLALAVARHLVMFLKRPGRQAQFSAVLSLQGAEDRFGALHSWMAGRLTDDLSLPALARKVGMSERSFTRHYVEATGITPARRGRAAAGGSGTTPALRYSSAGQARRRALRIRIGGNTAPKLRAPPGCDTPGLPSEVQRLSPFGSQTAPRLPYRRGRSVLKSRRSRGPLPTVEVDPNRSLVAGNRDGEKCSRAVIEPGAAFDGSWEALVR